jgi:hypothetical protein
MYVCLHGCAQQLNLGPLEVSVAQEYTSQFSITQLSISQSRMYEIKYKTIKYKTIKNKCLGISMNYEQCGML